MTSSAAGTDSRDAGAGEFQAENTSGVAHCSASAEPAGMEGMRWCSRLEFPGFVSQNGLDSIEHQSPDASGESPPADMCS